MTAFEAKPSELPRDAVRLIARPDIKTSVQLQSDARLIYIITFEDERVGNIAIALGLEAAVRLHQGLATMLDADEHELVDVIRTLMAADTEEGEAP